MSQFLQQDNYIIGTKQNIKKLASKKNATILAISDSHGNYPVLKKIIDAYKSSVDLIAFCGDGSNDLIHYIENENKSRTYSKDNPLIDFPVIAIVQGNGDNNLYPINFNPTEKNIRQHEWEIKIPKSICIKVAGMNIIITHGHIFGISYDTSDLESFAKSENSQLAIFGHTHIAEIIKEKNFTLINPGSCYSPRMNLPPSFATILIDGKSKSVQTTFYKINISLEEGVSFDEFVPPKTNFREF